MLIILEGPDLAGKSTLAAQLVEMTDATLLHRGPPTQHPLHEYVTPLLDYDYRHQHIVCDRWHLGEVVYPQVIGRHTYMNDGVRRYIDAFLASRGAVLVHVDAPNEVLIQRFVERGDEHRTIDEIILAAKLFRELHSETLPIAKIRDVDQIIEIARHRNRGVYESKLIRCSTYVGVPHPVVLYVGDVRGCDGYSCRHTPKHDPRFPAFGPFTNTCGEFLMNCLPPGFSWGLVNANDVDSEFLTYAESALHVVALGQEAHKSLRRIGIKHTTVPHPQYVKRFHHRDADEYRRLLSLRDDEEYGWKS